MQTVWLSMDYHLSIYANPEILLGLMPLCSSTIFTIEYNFDATQIVRYRPSEIIHYLAFCIQGLTNLGGIVGIVLAMCITGPLTDWGTVWLSKRNKGIYEPEFRILFLFTMLFGVFGYAGWAGEGLWHPCSLFFFALERLTFVFSRDNSEYALDRSCDLYCVRNMTSMSFGNDVNIFGSMANFSMVVSGSAAVTYLLDTHRENALHILALSNFGKNMVLYGFTFFANGMIARKGVKTSLLILAGCQAACWLASIPMYIFGKRVRSFVSDSFGCSDVFLADNKFHTDR